MKKWIEDLLALQNCDLRIRSLKIRLGLIPEEIRKLDEESAKEKKRLDDSKEIFLKHELDMKKIESGIAEKNTLAQKLQTQSAMIKKNEEYKAMLNEIAGVKSSVGEFETQQLLLMDKIEDDRKKFRQAEKIYEDRKKSISDEKTGLAELGKQLEQEIKKLSEKSEELRKNVAPEILSPYSRLLSRGTSTPFSPAKDGICGNCHLRLTPQTVNTARKESPAFCDNCSHMIYYSE